SPKSHSQERMRLEAGSASSQLTAAAVATALGLMTRFLLREWQPKRSRALRSYLRRHTLLARPHILALPVMVAWIATLIRAVDTRAAPPWRALPLMLCANLHGSFTFGLAIGMCSVTTALQVCKTFQTSCSYSTNTAYR